MDGAIAYPVQECTLAGNLGDLFTRVAAIGNDLRTDQPVSSPSLIVRDLQLGGS